MPSESCFRSSDLCIFCRIHDPKVRHSLNSPQQNRYPGSLLQNGKFFSRSSMAVGFFIRSWCWDRRLRKNCPRAEKPRTAMHAQKAKKSRGLGIRCWNPSLSGGNQNCGARESTADEVMQIVLTRNFGWSEHQLCIKTRPLFYWRRENKGLLEKGSFQKGRYLEILENFEILDVPGCGKRRRIGPSSRDSRDLLF